MTEYANEPIPGLPGIPPAGERILWQGSPDWRVLAKTAFHTRVIAGYFGLLAGWAMVNALVKGGRQPGDFTGVALTILVGILGVGLLNLLAWGSARTTMYTLTNRRIVFRVGMALPKCINLPLGLIGSVDLSVRADGSGDLPLTLTSQQKLGYIALWPHARPWKIATPQPMLRSIPDAAAVAAQIGRACLAANPAGLVTAPETAPDTAPQAMPSYGEAAAA